MNSIDKISLETEFTIKNTVSSDFYQHLLIVKSIFYFHLSGVVTNMLLSSTTESVFFNYILTL